MGIEYKKEFFDREYSLGETYGRVWKYARRYWLRIVIGIVTGMLTAGTLLCTAGNVKVAGVVGIGTIVTAFFMGPLIEFFNRKVAIPFLNR